MPWHERLAQLGVAVVLVGLPLAVFAWRLGLFTEPTDMPTLNIVAAAPENGGFQPDALRVAAGQPVRLRLSVPDVVHGLAIGPGLDIDLGQLEPGQVVERVVSFPQPGRYTLYCNTWCSPNHWRMRAVIEVYDPAHPEQLVTSGAPDPVILELAQRNIDIDAPHLAETTPSIRPSAARGRDLAAQLTLPAKVGHPDWRRWQSPAAAHAWLMRWLPELDEQAAWDLVAWLWLKDNPPDRRVWAADQYARNCVACHGQAGEGSGPGATALQAQGLGRRHHGTRQGPAAFNDPKTMLGGSSAMYYAKLRRGGMGSGMPDFGPIFSEDETWALVDWLWSFQFEEP